MRDLDIRSALHSDLERQIRGQSDTLVVDELGLCGEVRVDVAVVNGALAGYELKSERDTTRRLPRQAEIYSQVLDHATLVVADRHLAHARRIIPRWWGITVAKTKSQGLELCSLREPKMNPKVDPNTLVQLLWRDEVLDELASRDLVAGFRSKPRLELWRRLSGAVELDELRSVVRDRLRQRSNWRAAQ